MPDAENSALFMVHSFLQSTMNNELNAGEVMVIRGGNKKARSLIELIITWVAIFIVVGFLISRASILLTSAKEATLTNELSNLRLAVLLYYMLHKTYPDNIEMLIGKSYKIYARKGPMLKGMFLNRLKYGKDNKLRDPFGKIYLYNPQTGMVKSQTGSYRDW